MVKNNKLKEINNKDCSYHDLIKLVDHNDFIPENIYVDKKLHLNILTCYTGYKTLFNIKPLFIIFNKWIY